MTNVRKKDGGNEKFNRTKIERSIRRAGADEKTAKEIASKVKEREGMTTDEIRRTVAEELKKRKAEMAERYEDTRLLDARKALDAAKGVARLTEENMRTLNLKAGDRIEIMHENKKHTLKTEKAMVGRNEIRLHKDDMKAIGAKDGTRIVARRQM